MTIISLPFFLTSISHVSYLHVALVVLGVLFAATVAQFSDSSSSLLTNMAVARGGGGPPRGGGGGGGGARPGLGRGRSRRVSGTSEQQ